MMCNVMTTWRLENLHFEASLSYIQKTKIEGRVFTLYTWTVWILSTTKIRVLWWLVRTQQVLTAKLCDYMCRCACTHAHNLKTNLFLCIWVISLHVFALHAVSMEARRGHPVGLEYELFCESCGRATMSHHSSPWKCSLLFSCLWTI